MEEYNTIKNNLSKLTKQELLQLREDIEQVEKTRKKYRMTELLGNIISNFRKLCDATCCIKLPTSLFDYFDEDGTTTINVYQLTKALEDLKQKSIDEYL